MNNNNEEKIIKSIRIKTIMVIIFFLIVIISLSHMAYISRTVENNPNLDCFKCFKNCPNICSTYINQVYLSPLFIFIIYPILIICGFVEAKAVLYCKKIAKEKIKKYTTCVKIALPLLILAIFIILIILLK